MGFVRRWSVVVGVTAVVLTSAVSAGAFVVGPGPRAHYSVQRQPPPGHCHYRFTASHQPLPDAHCTPGAISPAVTPSNVASTICRAGYTASVRPPEAVTEVEKRANAASYGYRGSLSRAEYDHLIPLELGGDPNDPRNLWVEPPSPGSPAHGVNNLKDTVENRARSMVCAHQISLRRAQLLISANWTLLLAHHASPVTTPTPSTPSPGAVHNFANCAALRVYFPHGVGLPGAHDHTSGTPVTNFYVSRAWYLANRSHDGDHDGIACEHH